MGYWFFRATDTEYSLCESPCVFALLSSTTKAGPPCLSCIPKGVRPARGSGSCGRGECLRARPVAAWWGATASPPPAQWSAVPTTPTSPRYRIDAKTWLPPRWVTVLWLLMPVKKAWEVKVLIRLPALRSWIKCLFHFFKFSVAEIPTFPDCFQTVPDCFITFFFSKLKSAYGGCLNVSEVPLGQQIMWFHHILKPSMPLIAKFRKMYLIFRQYGSQELEIFNV